MTNTRNTIKAVVSPGAINAASRLFNASLEDVINELLQNSRRAGATRVEIAINYGKLWYRDNGCGLKDPQTLLSLGGSGWDADTQQSEDPAGMGFFSLSKREIVVVKSRDWSVVLDPDVFSGAKTSQVRLNNSEGFYVDFTLTEAEEAVVFGGKANAVRTVERCARYYPLPVFCDGVELPHESFLNNCIQTLEWQGVTLGVTSMRQDRPEGRERNINFHGLTIKYGLANLVCNHESWKVLADVNSCHQIKMTLPRREAIVEDEFALQLKQQALKLLLSCLMSKDHDLGHEWFVKAQELGVENIKESQSELFAFAPDSADPSIYPDMDKVSTKDIPVVLVDAQSMDAHEQQLLWLALGQSAKLNGQTLVVGNPAYRGYTWYNRLPMLSSSIEITKDDRPFMLDEFALDFQLESKQPDSIKTDSIAMVMAYFSNSVHHRILLPIPLCFYISKCYWGTALESATIITSLADSSPSIKTRGELFDLLRESFYSPEYEDFDSQDAFDVEASRRLAEALGGEAAGAIAALEAMALNICNARLSDSLKLKLTISPRLEGEEQVSVVVDEGVILPH